MNAEHQLSLPLCSLLPIAYWRDQVDLAVSAGFACRNAKRGSDGYIARLDAINDLHFYLDRLVKSEAFSAVDALPYVNIAGRLVSRMQASFIASMDGGQ